MKDLLVLLSKEMPLEMHIEQMERAISTYKEEKLLDNVTKESKQSLLMGATMISIHLGTEESSTMETVKALDKVEQGHDLMSRINGDDKKS